MSEEPFDPMRRRCSGILGRGAHMARLDSFPSEKSRVCRQCQSEYDRNRGSNRGATRASRKEEKMNSDNNHKEDNTDELMSTKNPELGLTGKGVAPISIPVVNRAIAKYVAARDARMELTTTEVETKRAFIKALRDNQDKIGIVKDGETEVIKYKHDDVTWTLKHGKDELKSHREKVEQDEE